MTAMLEAKKADNPTAYFDPFDEGEPMSEQAARDFWKKRFESHPYRGKQ
jgi:hypothetical protein